MTLMPYYHEESTYIISDIYLTVLWGYTGTLDGLVGSHTRLAIHPTLAICYGKVVICASLDTRFKGM